MQSCFYFCNVLTNVNRTVTGAQSVTIQPKIVLWGPQGQTGLPPSSPTGTNTPVTPEFTQSLWDPPCSGQTQPAGQWVEESSFYISGGVGG